MSFLSNLESRLGLTRGDVTIALFLAATALAGFIYITFFDARPAATGRRELMELALRHDSIVAKHKEGRRMELDSSLAAPDSSPAASDSSFSASDSIPAWKPLDDADALLDERAKKIEKPDGGRGRKEAPARPIDLNTARKEELMKLPGVGEKTALAIIERRTHIPFRRVEEIMEVKGIGEKKFEKMKPYITVN